MKIRGNWLKERREELKTLNKKKFSTRALASRVGVSAPGLSHLENSNAMPALDIALKLARELDKPVEWVLTGIGNNADLGIPIIGTLLTGPDNSWLENGCANEPFDEYVNVPIKGRRLYGLIATSDAYYNEGEVVVADPDMEPVTGEEVIVVTKDDETPVAKILASQRDGKVYLDTCGDRSQRVIKDLGEIILIHPIVFIAKSIAIKIRK